jgi:unsaturated rhamnogalacturonyl hydrolase
VCLARVPITWERATRRHCNFLRKGPPTTIPPPTRPTISGAGSACTRRIWSSSCRNRDGPASSLIAALASHAPSETGTIPALHHQPGSGVSLRDVLKPHLRWKNSPAREEIRRRVARTPVEVATELGQVYGKKLDSVAYIPAMAVMGRMRLGELTGDLGPLREAEALAEPFRTGSRESMGDKANGSNLSGHLLFAALAAATGDARDLALVRKAADYGFDANGQPKESMPFHSEMSDSVFMGCAPLAEAAALTGDARYAEMCLRHLRFMQRHCLRDDGIYRHSPLDESAWGRGNGFPALGMTLSLSALPEDSAAHAAFLQSYRDHLTALRRHQDPTGAWHQVIDHPESYREFTATCMITFAIVRGIRRGWLDAAEWSPVAEKAWTAIKSRIGPKGRLVDVCTGTGKMNSLRDYYDRTAILGADDRGGAMALLVATEMAFWQKEKTRP